MDLLYIAILFSPVIFAVYLGYIFTYRHDRFGSLWVGLLMFTLGLWSISQGFTFYLLEDVFVHISRILLSLSAVFFFLFVIEYTIRQSVPWQFKIAVFSVLVAIHLISVLTPTEAFVRTVSASSIQYNYTFELLTQVLYSGSLYLFSIGILIRETLIDVKKDKIQDVLLIVFGILALYFITHPLITTQTTRQSIVLCSLAIILIMTLFIFGISNYNLFNLKSISYANLLKKIQNGYIALDEQNDIIERDYSFDKEINEDKVKQFIYSDKKSEIIHVQKNYSTDLYYQLQKKSFKYGTNSYGTLIIIIEVSELKQKEKNLQLLRQVFSRFLRHNIRNRLTVINGFLETLDLADNEKQKMDKIQDSTDELLGNSQKALLISKSTKETIQRKEVCIKELVKEGINDVDNELVQNAKISIEIDKNVMITGHTDIATIISNAVENSIEHNPTPVEISIVSQYNSDTNEVSIVVEDNGTGIEQNEIDVINNKSESPLEHGNGIGLWTMKIITTVSNGTMNLVSSKHGSEIQYVFISNE